MADYSKIGVVGWYCDIGISNESYPTKMSDFVFYDKDRPLGFSIFNKAGSVKGTGGIGYNELATDYYNKCKEFIGDSINSFYLYPIRGPFTSYENRYTEKFFYWIPSASVAYPLLWQHALETSNPYRIAIYFKSLNKILNIVYDNTQATAQVLGVGSDGSLVSILYIYSVNWAFGGAMQSYSNGVFAYKFGFIDYTSVEDFFNPDKLYKATLTYGPSLSSGGSYADVSCTVDLVGDENNASTNLIRILTALLGSEPAKPDIEGGIINVDPNEPGGNSDESDLPPGTFDNTSDPIPDSPLPTLSAANTGFTRIYNPTLSQVQSLARYLWTDESVIETIWNHIKQFFENPMEAIIGFNLVPCEVPDAGTQSFALMYIDTGVSMNVAATQFVDVDCGSVELKRYWGSALDQSPYTKVSCFLPFIGMVQLNTDEVMGTTLNVKYRIDIVSGSCVAKIFVDGNCLYQYSGHCAITVPISSADFSSYVSAAISVAKLAVGAAVGGGVGAISSLAGDPSQQTNQVTSIKTTSTKITARNPETGRQITTGTRTKVETTEVPEESSSTQASFSGLTPSNIANTVGQVMGSKPHVEHSGSFSGNSGYLGVRYPYLIIERPRQCLPTSYQQLNGYPSMITMSLGSCSGFTMVQQVQLTGVTATNPEQAEILQLLKSGVIL